MNAPVLTYAWASASHDCGSSGADLVSANASLTAVFAGTAAVMSGASGMDRGGSGSGAVATTDTPCGVAARVAAASRAHVIECTVDGFVATVQVQAAYAGLAAVSRARAGPPEG